MKLKKILKDVAIQEVKGPKDIEITGVCSNSKLVCPGNLFIAKGGLTSDGTQYIPEALEAGAAAVLTDIFDPFQKQATQLIDSDLLRAEADLLSVYYQNPSRDLFMVGVTGTNGKTTTSYWVKHLLDHIQGPCGLLGTIEYIIGNSHHKATHTTADVATNHKMLREMVLNGCRAAVMEVSSHALDQGRVRNLHYDVAVFTNLTEEHLDYHKTMQAYSQSKSLLFQGLDEKATAVINSDDIWEDRMKKGCKARILTYSMKKAADLTARDITITSSGTRFSVCYEGKAYPIHWPHVGRFNIYNCLATIGVGIAKGASLEKIIDVMSVVPPVSGRLEPVPNNLGIKIYVDFSHTDDSLANVLSCLKEFATKRIITVFGCGGDRDKFKRPRMARVAEELSDFCIVTSDNPRSEDPIVICKEISSAFEKGNHAIEPDRRRAIALAIDMAKPDDIVLIAGKGHETYQIFAHQTIDFDDRLVARQLCEATAGVL